jgi:hypothetical protein
MADIVCSTECAGGVSMSAFPSSCTQTDFGFPKMVILASSATAFTAASDYPTVSDFEAAISTGGSDVIVINDISNGVKIAGERQEITDGDTADNLPEVISEREGIDGNLKRFNTTILNDLEALNCHKRLRMWYITNKGYCFGGKYGYLASNYVGDWAHDGFGNRSYIPISFRWMREEKTSDVGYDLDYLDITNAS